MVFGRAAVDDVDDDGVVLDLEVLGAPVEVPRRDVERARQPVHGVHVEAELGHEGLREVVDALPGRLRKEECSAFLYVHICTVTLSCLC